MYKNILSNFFLPVLNPYFYEHNLANMLPNTEEFFSKNKSKYITFLELKKKLALES
jgi:hypothetical protein